MVDFDPNQLAAEYSGIFGLPYTIEESRVVLIPVPWDATSHTASKSAEAPKMIFDASMLVELCDPDLGPFYEEGIAITKEPKDIRLLNRKATKSRNDNLCGVLKDVVQKEVKDYCHQGKTVGVIGGDHSVSLGAIAAHLSMHPLMGVLHIDAHADLRDSLEGLSYSHACVMKRVLQETDLKKLVQVGVRGVCKEEMEYIVNNADRIATFFDEHIARKLHSATPWKDICNTIVGALPDEVYISLDVDGLSPELCPNTGSPVPGGLSHSQLYFLLHTIIETGRTIVGFDIVETGFSPWDASVSAHILYKLCGCAITSVQGRIGETPLSAPQIARTKARGMMQETRPRE